MMGCSWGSKQFKAKSSFKQLPTHSFTNKLLTDIRNETTQKAAVHTVHGAVVGDAIICEPVPLAARNAIHNVVQESNHQNHGKVNQQTASALNNCKNRQKKMQIQSTYSWSIVVTIGGFAQRHFLTDFTRNSSAVA
jgi:hypothetical protein